MTPALDSRCLPDASPREILVHAATLGFTAVDLVVRPPALETLVAETGPAASSPAAAVRAVTLETDPAECLTSISPDARRAARRQVVAALDAARALRATTLRLEARPASPPPRPPECHDDVIHLALEALLDLRFEAQARAVRLACAVGRRGFLASPPEARDFFDRINSPWVGAWLDLTETADLAHPPDWIRTLGWRLAALSLETPAAPGRPAQTTIDWPAVAAALRDARYDGLVTLRGRDPAAAAAWLADRLGPTP